MNIKPEDLCYSESHEWAYVSDVTQGIATIGISSFAVEQLTDLVFMALPKVGQKLEAGGEFGEVESVKAVSILYSPLSGEVTEVHSGLVDQLDLLNQDPYNAGWIMKLKMSNPAELDGLMDWAAYQKQISESH